MLAIEMIYRPDHVLCECVQDGLCSRPDVQVAK